MSLEDFIAIFSAFGLGGVVVFAIFMSVLANPLVLSKIPALVKRGLHRLGLATNRARIGGELESALNETAYHLQKEMPGVFNKSLRLRWITDGDHYAKLKDGDIVLNVRDNINADELLTDSTMLFVKTGIMPEARQYIERDFVESIDSALAQRFLSGNHQAYEYLQSKYVGPRLADEKRRGYFELACSLDDHGVLTRIVMAEFGNLAMRLSGRRSTANGRAETVNFARFVEQVVTTNDDLVPLRFAGNLFSTTVALVANPETRALYGIRFYQKKFAHDIDSGVRVIHLLGRGHANEVLIRSLASWGLQSGKLAKVVPRSYVAATSSGRRIRAICISCYSAKVPLVIELNPVEEMYSALYDVIPETLTREVQVVAIAREPNVRSKIIIRSPKGGNPKQTCAGPNGENIDRLKSRLGTGDELIDFVLWDSDPAKLVINVLYPLRETEVFKIDFHSDKAKARVALISSEIHGLIIGRDGINVRLAEKVSGYDIEILEKEALLSSQEIAIEVISRFTTPISTGDVVVKGAVRHDEIVKVLVSSNNDNNAAEECYQAADFTRISSLLAGEIISFVEWDDSIRNRVCNALFPLEQTEIVSCTVDEKRMRATVKVVTAQAARKAVGQGGKNVKAAGELTGYRIEVKVAG